MKENLNRDWAVQVLSVDRSVGRLVPSQRELTFKIVFEVLGAFPLEKIINNQTKKKEMGISLQEEAEARQDETSYHPYSQRWRPRREEQTNLSRTRLSASQPFFSLYQDLLARKTCCQLQAVLFSLAFFCFGFLFFLCFVVISASFPAAGGNKRERVCTSVCFVYSLSLPARLCLVAVSVA